MTFDGKAPDRLSGKVLVWSAGAPSPGLLQQVDAAAVVGGAAAVHVTGYEAALDWLKQAEIAAGGGDLSGPRTEAGDAGASVPRVSALVGSVRLLVLYVSGAGDVPAVRNLSRTVPQTPCVLVLQAEFEAQLRRALIFSAPSTGIWHFERSDDADLTDRILAVLTAQEKNKRLRTTLDRMTLGASRKPAVESTEHRRLVASELLLGTVLRHASDAIVSLDEQARIRTWNEGAAHMFGIDAQHAIDRTLSSLFERPGEVEPLVASAAAEGSQKAECTARVGPAQKHIELTLDLIRDDAGHGFAMLAVLRDVTEQRRNEQELVAAGRQKDEFLAMLAHELRNPLSPIRSAAEILRLTDRGTDPRTRRAIDIISRQVHHLTGLVDDLLDVARVTRGSITLDQRVCPVSDVVAAGIEQARSLIDAKQQRLTVQLSPGDLVLGDGERLTQVFANLVNNAAKYTAEGGAIGVSMSSDGDVVKVSVSDTGVGIGEDLLPRVFDLFTQGERSPDRAQGGLGVGLSLVKTLVEAHGGRVSAHSLGTDRGSTFTVALPLTRERMPAAPPVAVAPFTAGNRLRLMVVDDNRDAADTLGELLATQGHHVDVHHDPLAALAQADESAPDVFILDIGMPHMDGYELAQRLRQLQVGSHAVIIALTGYGQPEDRLRSRHAGFDHHLVKPLDAALLSGLLAGIVPAPRHRRAPLR